jgi:hypothetical protein
LVVAESQELRREQKRGSRWRCARPRRNSASWSGVTMKTLAEMKATLVRVRTKGLGRRATVLLAPELTAEQSKAVKAFDLGRRMPTFLSSRS